MYTTDGLWMGLRNTRWKPPRAATATPERAETYVFAIEQAEQMFRAAATVGPATQPLLIFYGLSQAGRAIMAAAPVKGDQWQLVGHGVSQDPKTFAGPLADIAITTAKPGMRGSFVRLSEALDSPVWGDAAVPFSQLWDCLPGNYLSPLTDASDTRRMPLHVAEDSLSPESHPMASVRVSEFPPWVVSAGTREAFMAYLSSFPGIEGYEYPFRTYDGREPNFMLDESGWGFLYMHWPLPTGSVGTLDERLALIRSMTRQSGYSRLLVPTVGSNTKSMHPLMTWWAVLHTLSMLARYEPARWSKHIHVDASPAAVPIEGLLREAVETLPSLIWSTIDEISGGELSRR